MRNGDQVDLGEIDLVASPGVRPRPPSRGRRRLLVAALAVAAVLAIWPQDDDEGAEPSPAPEPAPGPTGDPITAFDVSLGIDVTGASAPREVNDIVILGSPVGAASAGSLARIDLTAVSIVTRLHDVPLWPGDFRHPMLVVGDRLLWSDLTDVWSMPLDLSADATDVGDALMLVPSRAPDRVWLVTAEPMRASEVDVDGAVVTPERELPPSAWPMASVDAGLVLEAGDELVVWDPASGSTTFVHDARPVLAASGRHLYLDGGLLVDVATGTSSFLERRPRDGEAAAFSPDGSHLALFGRLERVRDVGLTIYEIGAAAERRQFHQLLSATSVVGNRLVWSPDGDAVYLAISDRAAGGADRIIGIRLGGSAQTVARVNAPGWYWLAVGQASTR